MKIIKSKIFKTLVSMFVLGVLLGVVSYFVFGSKDSSIINYFETIKNEKFNYSFGLINSISYNYKYLLIIWTLGIIFILSFLIPIIICFRGISLGFTICLIVLTYKLKGLILSIIILFPCILLNELIYIFQGYYGIVLAHRTFNVFKDNKSVTLKYYIKNYSYRLIIFSLLILISSFFEIYITSNIIKYVL